MAEAKGKEEKPYSEGDAYLYETYVTEDGIEVPPPTRVMGPRRLARYREDVANYLRAMGRGERPNPVENMGSLANTHDIDPRVLAVQRRFAALATQGSIKLNANDEEKLHEPEPLTSTMRALRPEEVKANKPAPAAAPAAPPAPAPQPQPEDSLLQDSLHVEADDLTFTSSIPIISPDNSPKMHQYMVRDEPVVEGEDTEIVETEEQTVSSQARPATAPQPTVKPSDSKAQQSRHTADAQSEADENRINVAPVPLNLPSPIRAMDAQGLDLSVLDEKSQQDSASAQADSASKAQSDAPVKSPVQRAQTGALPAQKAAKNGSAKRKPSATGTVPKIPARTGSMPKVSDRTGSTPKVSEQKDAAPKVVNPWNTVRLQNPMGADSPSQASDRTGSTPKVSPRTGSVSRVSSSRTGSVPKVPTRTGSMSKVSDRTGSTPKVSERTGATPKVNTRTGSVSQVSSSRTGSVPKVPTRTGSMSKVSDRTGSTPKVSERTGATPKVNARTGSLSQVKKSDSTPAKSPATGSTSAVKPSPQNKDAKPVAPSKNKPGFDKALNDGKNLTSDQATELAQRVSARTEKAMTSSIAKVNAAKSPRRLGNTASMKQVPATNTDETVSKYESIETSENKSLSLLSWIVIIGCIILAILGVYMFISNQR
ncbi:hypothetical protein HMPREF0733_12065 [Rothia dentocariosa ATCC 17931]|uniref:Uncharacterized protein n=1 Tax=Rothia dentocariosa (strain ATCC 17931 / CDC X599 / XDIA) TaxID=762948 RepID=E3H387_ROTDC|nr:MULTISPECIES: hypothetical protein [Rothia]ADP41522.1 hypothetical protein HMPREF0733_12065 [Rothia dentocariosa ATCC 17931]OFN48689.1 hypothetical protein HMPREF2554_06045 [Rothia sp. HMSC071F11]WMS32244.1 hypothetical protein RDV56_03940 [Rothia dentocariosa]SUE38391.1 Uncharacterised protein [Rothia dentocariosa]